MARFQEVKEAVTYVAAVLGQVAELRPWNSRDRGFAFNVAGAPTSVLRFEVGSPYYEWRTMPHRAEQVVLRMSGAKRSKYGWVDLVRTFRARDDGSFNGAGIINAARDMIEAARRAQASREERDARDKADNEKRADNKQQLLDAGFTQGTVKLDVAGLEVSLGLSTAGVELKLYGLSTENALRVLSLLGAQPNEVHS